MRGCLSSVSYAILVNGNAKGWVKASRGLRQSDPLSPFLFTIVADVLSRMLLKVEARNLLEGFRIGRNRWDDTILLLTLKRKNCKLFFLIDKQPNILEKAKKPHVYRGYTEKPKKQS